MYVNTSLINSAIVGNQLTSAVCFIPFSILPAAGQYMYYTTESARKWYPLAVKNIAVIGISLTLSTGAAIPFNAGTDYST